MPKPSPYMRAANAAHGHLLRGFDKAWKSAGQVPLGHNILDPRTVESRQMNNMALMSNPEGMTSGLPQTARKAYQRSRDLKPAVGEGQTDKNKAAGLVVHPTAHETFTGADNLTVDTGGAYGITPGPWPNN